MKQYIVDAFTATPFSVMKLALENNLSETAFIVKETSGYHLRWFTPGTEVEICGHATLASSFVILNYYESGENEGCFRNGRRFLSSS